MARLRTTPGPVRLLLGLALSLTGSVGHSQPIVIIHPKWIPLGPTLISNGQAWPGRTPATGRINAVAPNPSNPRGDVWIGSATGGVWHGSLHPQNFWEPMTDEAASLAVGALRLDSCSAVRCETVWVGTGENGIRRDTQHGRGVLRGRWTGSKYTWQLLGESSFSRGSITGLVLDPSTPDNASKKLFVALSSGVTSNATHSTVTTTPAGPYGIWKSTNSGQTWVNVLNQNTPATDLEMDPQNPQILYAGLRRKGIFRSLDGGVNWQTIHNGIPASVADSADWPEIAVHRTPAMSQATLYAVLGACPHPHEKGDPSRCSPAVYKSTDGGSSWTQAFAAGSPFTTSGEPLTTYTSYAHALTIHPSKPETLWYGGLNLYKSTNGGSSWSKVGNTSLHPDHHQVVVLESGGTATGDLVFDVNDGGLYVGDGESVWNGSYQHGLEITQFQSVSTSGLVGHIIGGTQDNGTNVFLGSDVWEHVDDGDAASTNMDLGQGLNMYDVYVGAEPRRCTKADFCKYQWPPITVGIPSSTKDVSWYPPFVQDANPVLGQHPLFFATNHLFRSNNDANFWTPVTTGAPLGGTGTVAELAGVQNPISAVAIAPSDSNRLYVGYYGSQVFTTTNGQGATPTWTKVDGNGLPNRPVTSIAVHPTDPKRAYVAFTGFGPHSIYSTASAGASWAPFDDNDDPAGALPTGPVNVLHVEAKPPHRMWAGTDGGVYSRLDPGPSRVWTRTSAGLPNVAVYDFDVSADGQRIYAATHGRGVWTMSTSPWPKIYMEECCGPIDLYDPAPFISIFVSVLEPRQQCALTLIEGDRVCSEGARDADGATLGTNARGQLVASKPGHYAERPLSFACYDGQCAGGVPFSRCQVSDVQVSCGKQSVRAAVPRPVEAADPPSTHLGFLPGVARGAGSLTLSPMLKRNDGESRVLCSERLDFSSYESDEKLLARAAEAVNGSPRCRDAGVRAVVLGSLAPGTREDEGPRPFRLALEAPRLIGVQLVTEVEASGGGSFTVDSYGVPARDTRVVPLLALSGTARGGELRITERSPLGSCTFTIRSDPGEQAEAVAAKAQRAFLAPEEKPGEFRLDPGCLDRQNPRDVSRYAATLRFPLGRELTVASDDPGLVFRIGSDRQRASAPKAPSNGERK